ncbi:hypothetical protein HGRIS_011477 [Hohenbuehelia grisea]|uniref:F-box domain-containing protein n=1 Tax=Hohenbuehelia grisea TaxID=104357 RepID=A0ABR3JVC1_9AGAR
MSTYNSPISKLPIEMLLQIFHIYCDINSIQQKLVESFDPPPDHVPDLVSLMRVSRAWRSVVVDFAPRLWSVIVVSEKSSDRGLQWARLCVDRSASVPLHIMIHLSPSPSDGNQKWFSSLMSILLRHHRRWKSIHMPSIVDRGCDCDEGTSVPPRFEMLETATVYLSQSVQLYPFPFFAKISQSILNSPLLDNLESTVDLLAPMHWPPAQISNLRIPRAIHLPQLSLLANHFTHLRKLDVFLYHAETPRALNPDQPAITFPKLESLHLAVWSDPGLLRFLKLPALRVLETPACRFRSLAEMLSQSSCPITDIEFFRFFRRDINELTRFLRHDTALKSLKRLVIVSVASFHLHHCKTLLETIKDMVVARAPGLQDVRPVQSSLLTTMAALGWLEGQEEEELVTIMSFLEASGVSLDLSDSECKFSVVFPDPICEGA